MRIEPTTTGLRLTATNGTLDSSPAAPEAALVVDGERVLWRASHGESEGDELVFRGTPDVGCVRLTIRDTGTGSFEVRAYFKNDSPRRVRLESLTPLAVDGLRLGGDRRRWRIYRNGYQSWAGTHTLGSDERDRDFAWRFARIGTTDARHRAPTDPGHVRSDVLSAVCDPESHTALAAGFTTLADAFGFVEIDAGRTEPTLRCWADFDGIELAPGATSATLGIALAFAADDDAGWTALATVAHAIGDAVNARGRNRPHPAGWCSWYYYFAKVTEKDVRDNLAVLAGDGRDGPRFGCEYVMIDDGHQTAIGDWLTTDANKFPGGMPALATAIRDAGFDAGIWWAPFLAADNSEIARRHPEWLVRNQRGKAIIALLNPHWGITVPMRVLDTTHPDVLAHLTRVASTIGHDWGYAIQKLDFLYAASLPGVRHDANATRAQSLRRGLEAIRRGAGDESFLLGCGCPLGQAIGVVDAMRIGADVTPYWTDWVARTILLNIHGLATRHALMNTLTRAVLDGRWWLNDPDCLMLRDSETKLTDEEVQLMATVFAMTNGMLVLSDRLDRLPERRVQLLARARELSGGTPLVADMFEHPEPRVLISRHKDRIDVAAINLGDAPAERRIPVAPFVTEDGDGDRFEHWTGQAIPVRDGIADFGRVPPHAARVISFTRVEPE